MLLPEFRQRLQLLPLVTLFRRALRFARANKRNNETKKPSQDTLCRHVNNPRNTHGQSLNQRRRLNDNVKNTWISSRSQSARPPEVLAPRTLPNQ